MASRAGREVTLFFGGNSPGDEIPGVREMGLEMNSESIDITSGEDDGIRKLLALPGQIEVNVTLSGVTKSDRLKLAWSSQAFTQFIELIYPNGARVSGQFFMSTFKETEPYKDASTFETTLMSTGPVTFTGLQALA